MVMESQGYAKSSCAKLELVTREDEVRLDLEVRRNLRRVRVSRVLSPPYLIRYRQLKMPWVARSHNYAVRVHC